MPYARITAIRESAGLLLHSENETPSGDSDGVNKVYTVARRPIVDSNYDDVVDSDDVNVFANDTALAGDAFTIDPLTGTISLVTALPEGTGVTVDYYFSPLTEAYTEGKQQEADDWVDTVISTSEIRPALELPLNPVPGLISTVAEMYAAGIILTRDQGSRFNGELTSQDGFAKLKQARILLNDFIAGKIAENKTANSSANNSVSVITDRDVFSRDYGDVTYRTDDDEFMRPGAQL